ncbi:hypothetical protein DNK47_01355 [Mycoplasma wenyonii]|uniref:Uncharacterized protein n=1 Tax=Mycoplasma wenyonii TaxID=65123 RepID=A0A328PVH2_9MOLU|nr:hypothetical protein [Mycoplasma wenyonii]RAO95119.1 hypothetical protein DNK47_01355 [Mycoplasma wenyonii]
MPEEILETRGERIAELILPVQDKDIFEQWIEKIEKSRFVKPVLRTLSRIKNQLIKLIRLVRRLLRRRKRKPVEDYS